MAVIPARAELLLIEDQQDRPVADIVPGHPPDDDRQQPAALHEHVEGGQVRAPERDPPVAGRVVLDYGHRLLPPGEIERVADEADAPPAAVSDRGTTTPAFWGYERPCSWGLARDLLTAVAAIEVALDLLDGAVHVRASDGSQRRIPLSPARDVAAICRRLDGLPLAIPADVEQGVGLRLSQRRGVTPALVMGRGEALFVKALDLRQADESLVGGILLLAD